MSRYQRYLLTAPWWQQSLIFAVTTGAAATLAIRLQPFCESWSEAILSGVPSALVSGALIGPWIATLNRRARAAAGDLSDEQFAVSYDAALRGPVPTDPTIRQAASHLAGHRLEQLRRSRTFSTITLVVFIAASGYLAITRFPWCWLGAAFFAAILIHFMRLRARLARRLELLQPPHG